MFSFKTIGGREVDLDLQCIWQIVQCDDGRRGHAQHPQMIEEFEVHTVFGVTWIIDRPTLTRMRKEIQRVNKRFKKFMDEQGDDWWKKGGKPPWEQDDE